MPNGCFGSEAPADQKQKKAKAASSLRAFGLEQTDEWRRSPQGVEVQGKLEAYEQSLSRPISGRLIQLTEKTAIAAVAAQVNTDELLQRARGKIPEKRPDQTPAERVRELDLALASVPALRAERKQMAMLGRQQAAEQRQPKRRRSGTASAGAPQRGATKLLQPMTAPCVLGPIAAEWKFQSRHCAIWAFPMSLCSQATRTSLCNLLTKLILSRPCSTKTFYEF